MTPRETDPIHTGHRHKTKAGTWSDLTDLGSDRPHKHTIDLDDILAKQAEQDARLADHDARLAALEQPVPPPPPPPPPTTDRPFDPPVTSRTVTVPASIDSTGATPVGAALNAWLATVPDGSIVKFPAGTFNLEKGIYLRDRNHLVFEGPATLRLTGSGADYFASSFTLQNSNHIAIRGFHTIGNNTIWPSHNGENQAILTILGWYVAGPSSYVEMSSCSGGATAGDFIYIEGSNGGDFPASRYVWVHDNDFDYCGRNAVSLINSEYTWIERNRFDHIGMAALDFEPNFAPEGNLDAVFRNNVIGSYGSWANFVGFFVVASQPGGASPLRRVKILDNVVTGTPAQGYDGTPRGLDSAFWNNSGTERYQDIVFRGNRTSQSRSARGVLYFMNTDGVLVEGNLQPYTGDQLVLTPGCTNVVIR